MALETATYISQLVSTNPVTGDQVSQGDDHLRLIKSVLKAQFPNFTAAALTSTNGALDGVVAAVTGTLGVISPPLGALTTPSYTFVGDLNTGMYSPGADQVSIVTGGTAAIVCNASHNTTVLGLTSGNAQVNGTLGVTGAVTFTTPLTQANLAANSVGTSQIINANVTTAKLAASAVTATELASNAVTTAKILDANVTVAKIATDTASKCKVIQYDQSTGVPAAAFHGGPLLHVHESVAANTAGAGTFTAGSYQTRPITQVTNEITGAAVASNQITGLPAGTYMCMGYTSAALTSTAGATAFIKARVRDITGGATLLVGSTEASFVVNPQTSTVNTASRVYGRFTLAAPSTIEFQARFVGAAGGTPANLGENEVYTDLLIWRIA